VGTVTIDALIAAVYPISPGIARNPRSLISRAELQLEQQGQGQ